MNTPLPPMQYRKTNDNILSILNNTIGAVNIVKEVVPLELARGVLGSIAGILTLVKDTMKNKDDFAEVTDQCYKIAFMLWRATAGGSNISPSIMQALFDLKCSIETIQGTMESMSGRGRFERALHVTLDREVINDWKRDLSAFLQNFNTELSITANAKLDELLVMFEGLQTSKVSNDTSTRFPIPAMPAIFFGRASLVSETVESLISGRHVALIGPGGIGKSCLARAVLHDQSISARYGEHRYFVRYDDMDVSQVTLGTFIDRIASAFGIKASKASQQNLVLSFLSSKRVLLVLDNAETFLNDALDSGRIADIIDEFGALLDVKILLTTRSKTLPSNLLCKTLAVPVLGWSAAHQAFTTVYKTAFPSKLLHKLLSTLDYHPLSINLLAQVGVQNDWSPQELAESWEKQQSHLLEAGNGKVQSLTVTIELSLNSPSIKKLGLDACNFLEAVAFLPQGVNKTNLLDIFPSISNIHTIVNVFCKQSLMYYKGDYISMLAPIRLYISSSSGNSHSIPLLKDIRTYYHIRLAQKVDVYDFFQNDLVSEESAWIKTEDLNVERLIAFDLTTSSNVAENFGYCIRFLDHLVEHKPRSTALRPLIFAAIENHEKQKSRLTQSFKLIRDAFSSKKKDVTMMGNCIITLGFLANQVGQSTETIELFLAARDLFTEEDDNKGLMVCSHSLGMAYLRVGQFIDAESVLAEAIARAQKSKKLRAEACIIFLLGTVKAYRGLRTEFKELFTKAHNYFRENPEENFQMAFLVQYSEASGELFLQNFVEARKIIEETLPQVDENPYFCINFKILLAEVDIQQGNFSNAHELLDQARELALTTDDFTDASLVLAIKSGLAADQGDFALARTHINSVMEEVIAVDDNINDDLMNTVYISARGELLAGEYSRAKELFKQSIELCDALLNVQFKARSMRALGEIAVLENDRKGAKKWFSETKSLCESMGLLLDNLYLCFGCFKLGDNFKGWKRFQEGKI